MMPSDVQKRCLRCDVIRAYAPLVQYCREPATGPESRHGACHGQLVSVRPERPEPPIPCINCQDLLVDDSRKVLFVTHEGRVGPFCLACAGVVEEALSIAAAYRWDQRQREDALGRLRFGTLP